MMSPDLYDSYNTHTVYGGLKKVISKGFFFKLLDEMEAYPETAEDYF